MAQRFRFREKLGVAAVSLLVVLLSGCAGVYSGGGNSGGDGGGGKTAPAVPTGLLANAGNGEISLAWTRSSGATGYYVKRSTVSGGPYTQIALPATNAYTDTGLTNGTTYFYVVSAFNAEGQSANSAQASATPAAPVTVPSAPTGLQATAGNAQVSLIWTASTGATSYHIKRAVTSGGPYTQVSAPTTTSFADTGLTNGTTYYYVVSALNAAGESANSTQASATPAAPVMPPMAPTGLQAAAGNAQVSLIWTASAGATSYRVKRATISGGPYTQISAPTSLTYTDTGLTNGTVYFYVVSALDAAGESPNSTQVSATPVAPAMPPAAPTNLQTTAGNAQISLSWTASTGATSYHVKRSTTSGGPYAQVAAPTTTSDTDTGLTDGTAYYYVVSALNAAGESANSTQVSATPVAPPAPPSTPTGLEATAGNAQVALSWNASTGATSYNVLRSTTSGSSYSQIATPTTASYIDTGLTNGTAYYYVVSATNAAGTSANSTQASATPQASVPPDVTITVNPSVTHPISPYIYGLNFYSGVTGAPPLLTFDRDGGDRWTAYNWINNASNAGSDYLYENDDYLCNGSCNASIPAEAVSSFISGNQSKNMASLITLQMQGYVSIDTTVVQVPMPFPNLPYFRPTVDQKSTASSAPFTLTPPAASTDNHVYLDEFAWALDQDFLSADIFGANPTEPTFISLDNEPDLWNSTHQEIQGSTNVSSAAFVSKTVNLSAALKGLSKNAQTPASHFSNLVIFGPVNYGFEGIYSWQGDPTLSPTPNGNNWFADKYLTGLHAASTTYGAPLVDVYDFHWYAEVYDSNGTRITDMTGTTLTDAQVQLIVQSPRDLWDPTWTDTGNSNPWIVETLGGEGINMLGRLQSKIAAENPGMKLSVTEYNNGGSNHIAGTIAQADNLGVFGAQGLFAASLWPLYSTQPYILAGFRAYRGFDGANACFGDTSLQATSSNVGNVMVYASTDSTTPGRVVFVAINRSTSAQLTAINGQSLSGTAYLYQMTAATAQLQSTIAPVSIGTMAVSGSSLTISLPALSVTTIDVH
jgi:fibronectin type 3 domain-containing protein